jgi:hypothetical protein
MMNHSIAECTICAFKGLTVTLVYGFYKSDGSLPNEDELSEDEKIINIKNAEKQAKQEEADLQYILPVFDELAREGLFGEYHSEEISKSHDVELSAGGQ